MPTEKIHHFAHLSASFTLAVALQKVNKVIAKGNDTNFYLSHHFYLKLASCKLVREMKETYQQAKEFSWRTFIVIENLIILVN